MVKRAHFVSAGLAAALSLAASSAAANPVYLAPGQCVLVGGQQICAMQTDGSLQPKPLKVMHLCRFGNHADSEVGKIKTYALYQVIIKADGSKIETAIKNFGNIDKDGCEREAKRLDDEEKAAERK